MYPCDVKSSHPGHLEGKLPTLGSYPSSYPGLWLCFASNLGRSCWAVQPGCGCLCLRPWDLGGESGASASDLDTVWTMARGVEAAKPWITLLQGAKHPNTVAFQWDSPAQKTLETRDLP